MKFIDVGTLITPGAGVEDERTGNKVPGPATEVRTQALLQPLAVSTEAADGSTTVVDEWRLTVPPGVAVTAASQWLTDDGRLFVVTGAPSPITTTVGIPSHTAVKLALVSDLQETE